MKMDMRELLQINRKIDGLLETEAEVSQQDLDDALFYAMSMRRPQAKVKFEKLKRLYQHQQHELEVQHLLRTQNVLQRKMSKRHIKRQFQVLHLRIGQLGRSLNVRSPTKRIATLN